MEDRSDKSFSPEEKVRILLHEYNALRAEIMTRTNNMFQLFPVPGTIVVGLIGHSFNMSFSHESSFWIGVSIIVVTGVFLGSLIARDIGKAANRLKELESDINTRAGETLLIWETIHGGSETGYFWRGLPKRSVELRSGKIIDAKSTALPSTQAGRLPVVSSAAGAWDAICHGMGISPIPAEEAAHVAPWTNHEADAFEREIQDAFEQTEEPKPLP